MYEIVVFVAIVGIVSLFICLPKIPIKMLSKISPQTNITAASLAKLLHGMALVSLIAVIVVVTAPVVAPTAFQELVDRVMPEKSTSLGGLGSDEDGEQPENSVDGNGLLTAAATIMGLTVFGSALGTTGSNKYMIRAVGYTLIPTVTVQAVFMLHLVGILHFPAAVWIPMTAILLMLAVLAMIANKLVYSETNGDAPTD